MIAIYTYCYCNGVGCEWCALGCLGCIAWWKR